MVANPVAITLNTVDTTAEIEFPSAISGTIYFADTIFDVPSDANIGVIRSYNPSDGVNNDVTSGLTMDWVRAANPVFNGTQLAAILYDDELWIYNPVGGTWTGCGTPGGREIESVYLPSLNSNNIFVYDIQPPV